jgi:hypothetical protein
MPDEWPRRYTRDQFHAIAQSIGLEELEPNAREELQEAVESYQWASLADEEACNWASSEDESSSGIAPRSTNKRRREQLKHIAELCKQEGPDEKIETALNELDGLTSQLLGRVDSSDRLRLQRAAEAALMKIPSRGPNQRRARRQFIAKLAPIFSYLTGDSPTRRVHDQEYGPFRDFVKAALKPFKAEQGCEADIKAVLRRLNDGPVLERKTKARSVT